MKDSVRNFIRAVAQTVGNKRYLRDLEKLLERVDMEPDEARALDYLANDVRQLQTEYQRRKREPWRMW